MGFCRVNFSQMASNIATPIHQIEFRMVKFSQIKANTQKAWNFTPWNYLLYGSMFFYNANQETTWPMMANAIIVWSLRLVEINTLLVKCPLDQSHYCCCSGPVRSLLLMSQTLSHDDQSAGKSTSLQPFRKHLHHGGTYTGRRVTKGKAEEAVPIRLQGTNPVNTVIV